MTSMTKLFRQSQLVVQLAARFVVETRTIVKKFDLQKALSPLHKVNIDMHISQYEVHIAKSMKASHKDAVLVVQGKEFRHKKDFSMIDQSGQVLAHVGRRDDIPAGYAVTVRPGMDVALAFCVAAIIDEVPKIASSHARARAHTQAHT